MVHIQDVGSHFDAPVDVVWKYLGDSEAHGAAHTTSRFHKMTPVNESTFTLSMEQHLGGRWLKLVNRITVYPPLGMAIEVMRGPLAGSKMINVYIPHGPKTGISVFGEFTSAEIPAMELEAAVRANLETAFNEDNAALRTYTPKKK
jgi:hypothetical protein